MKSLVLLILFFYFEAALGEEIKRCVECVNADSDKECNEENRFQNCSNQFSGCFTQLTSNKKITKGCISMCLPFINNCNPTSCFECCMGDMCNLPLLPLLKGDHSGYTGSRCSSDSDCYSGECDNGRCNSGKAGSRCEANHDCHSNLCQDDVCAEARTQCEECVRSANNKDCVDQNRIITCQNAGEGCFTEVDSDERLTKGCISMCLPQISHCAADDCNQCCDGKLCNQGLPDVLRTNYSGYTGSKCVQNVHCYSNRCDGELCAKGNLGATCATDDDCENGNCQNEKCAGMSLVGTLASGR